MNILQQLLGVNTDQLQQEAVAAQQQLTQAFEILILEGAAAVILLAVIAFRKRSA